MGFNRDLKFGKVAEGLIARWLRSRGGAVMPVYEIEKSKGKGPQFFAPIGSYAAPDLIAFTSAGVMWVEAKHKTVFTWHRNSRAWTTGIDLRHFNEYQQVAAHSKLPVWLLFFHRSRQPDERDIRLGCPPECPAGLFGGRLERLAENINHTSLPYDPARQDFKGHGRSGMVYWRDSQLRRLATVEDLLALEQEAA